MLYKHWKKIALTMTAMFWAGCGNDSSTGSESAPIIESSSDGATQSSSSEEPASSSVMAKSSSSDAAESSSSVMAESSSSDAAESSSSVMAESSSSDAAESSSSVIAGSSSSFELPVPVYGVESLNCYNDTAVNDSGKVFDIIECIDGQKYLRFQSLYMDLPERQAELPQGVHPQPPDPRDGIAVNCTREVDICIDGFTIDENGNQQPVGGCYPSIECPEKPQN